MTANAMPASVIRHALEEIWNTKPCLCPGHLVR